jgi:hypothetical protein
MPSELKPVATPTQSTNTKQVQEYNGPRISPDADVELGDIMPISSYEGEKGFPFAAEYYKLDTPYEFLDSEIREDIEAIDGFVKDFIKDEEKEDTIASYAKTLKSLEKKLGIEDSMLRGASIKKVASLVKNYAKVAEVYEKNVKRKILNKLIKMSQEGKSQFNQTEYLLQEMGGMF